MEAQSRIVRNEFPWGVIEWLAGGEVGNSKELSIARVTLPLGKATDTHVHGNCEESVYVTHGRVECTSAGRSARPSRRTRTSSSPTSTAWSTARARTSPRTASFVPAPSFSIGQ